MTRYEHRRGRTQELHGSPTLSKVIISTYNHASQGETIFKCFRSLFEVCVVGLFNCSRAAFGPMSRSGGGSIINMMSIAGGNGD